MAKQESLAHPASLLPEQCTAVILAGGKATRLQSVVSDRPKILAEIAGRPFAHYLLTQLAQAGFKRAVICTGHLADIVEDALGPAFAGLEIVYSREDNALDTAGALRLALPHLTSRHCVVINGDTFVRLDFADMLYRYGQSGVAIALALVEVPDASRYGSVLVSPDGMITGFAEKAAAPEAGAEKSTISAGVYVLPRTLIAAIPEGREVSIEKDMMPRWIGEGVLAYASAGPFIDIGTPESYAQAQAVLADWADGA